jgi:tetratricopeptide (TPR) repeat protein
VPPAEYFIAFGSYYEGDYRAALRAFQSAARGGVRSTEGVWVDSICYATMIGECFYQMGEPAKALDQYNSALKLALAHKGWMLRVEFPDVIQPSASAVRSSITWGVSQRNTQLARIPDRMISFQGQMITEQTIRAGGAIASPQGYPLNAKEVIRCIALALRRRREIMGPVCQHDPLTAQLVADFATYPTRPNHWSQAWVSCLQGLAYASMEKHEQAVSELTKSLVLAGQYDHDLTPIALLELGKLAFQQGQSQAAAGYFLEATFPAMAFDQYDVLEEAFRWGLVVHLVSGQKGPYPPLAPAAVWARRHSRALHAWLLLLAAENRVADGDAAAMTLLGETRQAVGTRDLRSGVLGARFNYVSAQVEFQRGNLAGGSTQLAQSLAFLKGSSHRLYQIALADAAFVSGAVTQRVADDLYANVLREPTAADWALDPMETLAVVLTPHPAPLQRWLEAAMGRKDVDKSLEIADRIRRHRFYSSLPLGGRLLSLRWILEAPESVLTQQAALQRQDLLARYGNYAKLSAQATAVRNELNQLPLVAQKPEDIRKQTQLFEHLAQTSGAQELMLQDIALRREPSEFVFPPLRTVKEIQHSLTEEQLVLAYSVSDRYVLGFALSKNKSSAWQMESPAAVFKQISELLRQMGLSERKTGVEPAGLKDEAWKTTAADLLKKLTNNGNPSAWDSYRELIVIPDGPLWYVPFEALQVPAATGTMPLVSKVRLRYLPTAGLLTMSGSNPKPQARTLVVTGPMVPGQDKQVTATAFEAIQRSLDGVARGETLAASSNLVAAVCDRLVVLSDLEPSPRGPYGWSPMSLDRGKASGTLESWLALPWQGPADVVLPGFHTAAETGLKRGANGDEIFYAACGLMAGGSRSILLSRWPTAGQSAFDLVREYVQELPFVPAAEAWQRSVQLVRNNPLVPELEPRLSSAGAAVELTAEPPFFWAGYMLVDLGRASATGPRVALPPPAAKAVPSDPPEDAAPQAAPGKAPPAAKPKRN